MIVSIFRLANLSPSYQLQPLILRISILLLSAGISFARDPVTEATKNPMSLLPNGSVLHEVLLPRYDKKRVLVSDLKAEIMTLINPKQIQGENVLINFTNQTAAFVEKYDSAKPFSIKPPRNSVRTNPLKSPLTVLSPKAADWFTLSKTAKAS